MAPKGGCRLNMILGYFFLQDTNRGGARARGRGGRREPLGKHELAFGHQFCKELLLFGDHDHVQVHHIDIKLRGSKSFLAN